MGSPVGFSQPKVVFFLLSCEKQLLSGCSKEFKSVYYRHFVDDIFLLFKSSDHFQ